MPIPTIDQLENRPSAVYANGKRYGLFENVAELASFLNLFRMQHGERANVEMEIQYFGELDVPKPWIPPPTIH